MNYLEFNYLSYYFPGNIVWFKELAYIACPKDPLVHAEEPEDSDHWRIYWRKLER